MMEHFQDEIQFCQPEQRNESLIVFSSNLEMKDVIQKLRSLSNTKKAAQEIRKILLETEFDLEGRFCDAEELKRSWEKIVLPPSVCAFFSALFNINQTKLMSHNSGEHCCVYDEDDNTNEGDNERDCMSERVRVTKMKSLYQMMFYNVHNGRKKTPLHLMAAHNVYDKCKSRELITTLNRIGVCVSYNEIQRSRKNLAHFAFKEGEKYGVPIPSHFVRENFTIAALDNFDHADRSSPTGMMSNHDTVMVLFQIKPEHTPSKPNKSQVGMQQPLKSTTLPCQKLRTYSRGKKELILPTSFSVPHDTLVLPNIAQENDTLNFVLSCIRSNKLLSHDCNPIPTWAGCRSLLSTASLPLWQVGFIPYLPYPVTKHETVYTALHNFLSVLSQLEQKCLPVFCDEGVYCIVIDIVLKHSEEFKQLVPMMGGFHMAKAAMHCIGKYLKGCGIEDAFVETETFGIKVAESVIQGSHYVRAFRGLLIAAEAVESMKWDAFWTVQDRSNYEDELNVLFDLLSSLKDKDPLISKFNFQRCMENKQLMADFKEFSKQACENSDMCLYLEGLIENITHLKALIAADREGDWEGHLLAVQNLLPIFRECDSINYLRYATLYLEMMRRLPDDHPEIYEKFKAGNFVVNESKKAFSAVSPDMKLEQTIQRSQKSSSGIIGQTRQVSYVSEWEVVYHEILSISNAFRNLTHSNLGTRESEVHHELGGNYAKSFNTQVKHVIDFLTAHGNPYLLENHPKLHNFVTSVCAPSAVSECLINFYKHGEELYKSFRNERFVEKSRKLSDTIKKVNLPEFVPKPKEKTERKHIKSDALVKELSYVQKNIDIARVRGITLSYIMEHDLMSTNVLFCEETTRKPEKSVLVHELEKHFDKNDLTFMKTSKLETTLLIDFMSMIRRMPLSEMSVFLDLFQATWKKVKAICEFQRVDVVFDSYVEKSIKQGERNRRSCVQPLEYVNLENDTRIPVQLDRFWASSNNKEMVQCLSRSYLSEVAGKEGVQMVLSGYVSGTNDAASCIKIKEDGECVKISDLN